MKKLLTLVLLVVFLLVSCQDNNSIIQPENEIDILDKQPTEEVYNNKVFVTSQYTNIKDKYSKNYTIDGDKGGKIIEKHTWTYGDDTLKLEAYLTIPKGAFNGSLTFELVFDPTLLSVHMYPSPFKFDRPVILDLQFKGINADFEIISDSLDFQYYKPDGTFEDVKFDKILWLEDARTLKVFNAELHHFSRYGWTRNKPTSVD